MNTLEDRNNRIISAVLEKEKKLCPGAVALIGIYGSFQTGDIHPLSDLDLLILINDERGRQLETAFIQDDPGVGHDLYCTSWEDLRADARTAHPHISKLMDAEIVYCADEKYRTELEKLREQVRQELAEPFGAEDYQKAEEERKEAECCYTKAMIAEGPDDVRYRAGIVIYHVENAVALLNKTYFRRGVKRRYEELDAMERRPEHLSEMIDGILTARTADGVKESLTALMKSLDACLREAGQLIPKEKSPASVETISGTYEEMFSNWHGKMAQAAESGDHHLAFMSLTSLNFMLQEISEEVDIKTYNAMSAYVPEDLHKTAENTAAVLEDYLQEYRRAGIKEKRYADPDAFAAAYLGDEND